MSTFKNISVADLQALLGKVKLVDVRTDAEIARGFIQGATKLPLHLLPMRLTELERDAHIVFYCQMGGRSAQAAAFAAGQGYRNVYNLQGGILAWAQAGQSLAV